MQHGPHALPLKRSASLVPSNPQQDSNQHRKSTHTDSNH
jgi:hypothetical protein